MALILIALFHARTLDHCSPMKLLLTGIMAGLGLGLACASATAAPTAKLDQSLQVVSDTHRSAEDSQQTVDQLAMQQEKLLEEYRRLNNSLDYQQAYTRELEQLQAAQEQQLAALRHQIDDARMTQQRIVPLMRSMADALEKFVVLDLPFHHEQRIGAVLQLKQRLQQPQHSVATRFRLLLEAYQLELDYSYTTEAWRDKLELDDTSMSVEYLRIGRLALYFLSLDGKHSGYWDAGEQQWLMLDPKHNRALGKAVRVAKNEAAPQMLELPLILPGDAT